MNFELIRFIARRFYRSSRRRRFLNFARGVALISVMLGTLALILSVSILEGFDRALRENAVKFTSHLTIRSFNRAPLPDAAETARRIENDYPEIESVYPIIEREGLVRTRQFVEGALIRGIRPGYDLNNLSDNIVEGSFAFDSARASQVIIGGSLARRLGAKVGDRIVVYALNAEQAGRLPESRIDRFEVAGIYETGMKQYDDIIIYIPYLRAAEFLSISPDAASAYEVMLHDVTLAPDIAHRLEQDLGYPYYCQTVYDLHRAVFSWIELQKEPIPIVLGLISIVAVLNIITTLLITVVEKTRSIGILRSLGLGGRQIIAVFVFQGLTIALAGALIGAGLALGFSILQNEYQLITLDAGIYFLSSLPVDISPANYAGVVSLSLAMALAATLIPSWVAVRVSPLRAIRFK
ncbi:MAG: ABC transporter permease [Candidatus Kapaibacterium sp.]